MKKIITLFLLIIGVSSFSQTYHEFPDSNTIWNIYMQDYSVLYEAKRYIFYNDSANINGKIYSILYRVDNDTNCTGGTDSSIVSYFREDSLKRVWCRFDTTDYLLYDFSLNIGDTIYHKCTFYDGFLGNNSSYQVLDSIGDTLINGESRRIFYLSGWIQGNKWIEGIGAVDGEGLFAPIADICTCGMEYYLGCVKENDTVIYLNNPICNSCFCYLGTSTSVTFAKTESIEIYPNPAHDKLTVIAGEAKQSVERIHK